MSDFDDLSRTVAALGGEAELSAAQASVILCAVLALVQTHPEPAVFAAAFRKAWMLLGSPNESQPGGSQASDGIAQMLELLEEACPVPLNVRPPDAAATPGR